jgi:hypothetical protein
MKKLLTKIGSKEKPTNSPPKEKKKKEEKSGEKSSSEDDWGVDLKLFKAEGRTGVSKDDFELLTVVGKGSFAKVPLQNEM